MSEPNGEQAALTLERAELMDDEYVEEFEIRECFWCGHHDHEECGCRHMMGLDD